MANTFSSLQFHVIFSTKSREQSIGHAIEERVWSYLGGIARDGGMKPLKIGRMPDHIHMAIGLPTRL